MRCMQRSAIDMRPDRLLAVCQRREALSAIAAGLGFGTFAAAAASQFPWKPLRIVVPNAAGGAADITARTVGQKLSQALGQPVVIDNKPSAGGIVAGESVAHSEADGHTLLLISSGTAVSAAIFRSLPFDTQKDFAPVSQLANFNLVIAVSSTSRFKTIADLLEHGRANPGQLNIGTPQIGTTQHLAAELFLSSAGVQAQIVPFNGTPPVITALRGGSLDAMVEILGPVMPQIKSGVLHALAVMADQREPNLPQVPSLREAGGSLSRFHAASWNGLAVPAKTPKETILRLQRELQLILQMPDVKSRLNDVLLHAQSSSPEQVGDLLNQDIRRWSEVIARAKIEKQ